MIAASVMTVSARRVVQLMPRLTHHSSAQLITTGTTISSCNAPRLVGSAQTAGAAYSDADSTTDLRAGVGDRKEDVSHALLLSPLSDRCYRTNLTPTVWPRRQTTSQLRPVLASRANATR